jgi:hypothetical protein
MWAHCNDETVYPVGVQRQWVQARWVQARWVQARWVQARWVQARWVQARWVQPRGSNLGRCRWVKYASVLVCSRRIFSVCLNQSQSLTPSAKFYNPLAAAAAAAAAVAVAYALNVMQEVVR